jgi:TfoX/Sxy family transcriptional regulator of competence genes
MVWSAKDPEHAAAQERLDRLAEADYLQRPDVTWSRMFGTVGLGVRGKIFGVAVHTGGLMVKISEASAEKRIAAGEVTHMVMRGREMREWVVVPNSASDDRWKELLDEAYTYLDEITPR